MTARGRAKSNSAMLMQGLAVNTMNTDPGTNIEEDAGKSNKNLNSIASRYVQTKTPMDGKTPSHKTATEKS